MKEIRSEIEIGSSPDKVWQLLISSPGYVPDGIREAVKDRRVGSKLKVYIGTEGGKGALFTVRLLVAEPGRELRWKGNLWIPGLFDGEHAFEIKPIPDNQGGGKVLFLQSEKFSGLFLLFLSKTIKNTKEEFDKMNVTLKQRAEQLQTMRQA
jgi:hypothetical protein